MGGRRCRPGATADAAHLDLGKIQMFYFTLVLVLTYAAMLGAMFLRTPSLFQGNPPLPVPIGTLPSLPPRQGGVTGDQQRGLPGQQGHPTQLIGAQRTA
jgi:hypothetical protein